MLTWCLSLLTLLGASYAQLNQYYCVEGRDPIVHLFEWKWSDVASECSWLALAGYCGVQVSPPQEHAIITTPNWRPWWERYQPVSYELVSRSGSLQDFTNMVEACNNQGVWIYVDAIINHMTGGGNGTGSNGTYWNGGGDTRENYGGQEYPGVPFYESDFNPPGNGSDGTCPGDDMDTSTNNNDEEAYINKARNCRYISRRDLRASQQYVRTKVTKFLNSMIDIGVAGFRVDACKNMWPDDLEVIYGGLNDLPTRWFPSRTKPYLFQEVIDRGGEPIEAGEYVYLGRVTEFNYGMQLSEHILNYQLRWLYNFGEEWGFLDRFDALAFLDNHENQRYHIAGRRNHILTHKDPELYKIGVAYMLAWDYGHVRVMSSYEFDDTDAGPPSDGDGNTQDVVCQSSGGSWVCEHRWRQIANMVRFHNVAIGASVTNWWDNGNNAIAFSREDKAFIVINNEGYTVQNSFYTSLPAGEYCNVILCDGNRPPCSGESGCDSVTVQSNGYASISVPPNINPMVAIHV